MLPDDVLLIIFDFYVDEARMERWKMKWKTLVHVCRRWRTLVFQSPHHLHLRLYFTTARHTLEDLNVWPPLPLFIRDTYLCGMSGVNNIIGALEHNARVCKLILDCLTSSQIACVTSSAAMQKPFPELAHLHIYVPQGKGPILPVPDSFLGRTAPRLRKLILNGLPCPGLPTLLSSSTHLVKLDLYNIPHSGYLPPEAMATSLSAFTSLEHLRLHFLYAPPQPGTESRSLPPHQLTCSILPSFTRIIFKGSSKYLEEIIARIVAPRLTDLHITFFDHDIFDAPQLFQFISRRPTLRTSEKGYIAFSSRSIRVIFPSQASDHGLLSVEVGGSEVQTCSRDERRHSDAVHGISMLEDLYIFVDDEEYPSQIENTILPDLLRSFLSVENLYLSEGFVPRIAPALQAHVGGRTTEVFSTLENIFLEGFQPPGPLHECIENFVAARRLTNHPVAVSRWEMDPRKEDPRKEEIFSFYWDFYDL